MSKVAWWRWLGREQRGCPTQALTPQAFDAADAGVVERQNARAAHIFDTCGAGFTGSDDFTSMRDGRPPGAAGSDGLSERATRVLVAARAPRRQMQRRDAGPRCSFGIDASLKMQHPDGVIHRDVMPMVNDTDGASSRAKGLTNRFAGVA